MRRVVVTGMGVLSCIGNNKEEVTESLREARSGIRFLEKYQDIGLRSHVAGQVDIDLEASIDRKLFRFMGDAAAYAYLAMAQAIEDSGLTEAEVSNPRTGLIAGSGGASSANTLAAADKYREHGIRRIPPTLVPRTMGSTVSACLSTSFKIKGVNYSITSACASSGHCIGNAMELIQLGKQDVIFAGGGEEEDWTLTMIFDATRALTSKYNDTPLTASRPYDVTRDGFAISCGGGMFVLEELEHARARGAKIYAEVVGYGATSDGDNMVIPSGDGAIRCMRQALETVDTPIDFINAHGTSTPVGDITELRAIEETFDGNPPPITATKSLTGHSLGAAAVHEAIYSLLMMENNFIAESANITELDPEVGDVPIVRERQDNVTINAFMSNSFGFGGTNCSLVLKRI
ncbi:MAG: beta-ketoacyl-ACP synthase I [bacterium]|nr:beta-ketoacyl-ACP synthase I [bacterium]